MIAQDLVVSNQCNRSLWSHSRYIEIKFQWEDYVSWFLGVDYKHVFKFQRKWFKTYRIQYVLPNNIVILVTINKLNPNLILVNINKFTPYRFIENRTLHLVLTKPNDLTTKKPFQIEIFEPLLVEDDFLNL